MSSTTLPAVRFLTQDDQKPQSTTAATTGRELLSSKDSRPASGSLRNLTDQIRLEIQSANRHLLPVWVLPTSEALAHLLQLPEGWNSHSARPIELSAVRKAIEILKRIMLDATPPPDVVPTPRGGVQFEWHTAELDLEITLPPTGAAEFYYKPLGGEAIEGKLPDRLIALQSAVASFSTQASG